MEEEDQFIPDLNALLEVSLVEENVPSSNSQEETQTTDEKTSEKPEEDDFFSQRPNEEKTEKSEGDDDKQPTEAEEKPQVSAAETPAPAVAEPVPNETQIAETFKLPDLSNATDQQKELHNFKVSLLPKDISEEEKAFYLNAIDDIKSVTCMRLHCTVCNEHIGCQPEAEDNTFSHITLHVLMCKHCYEFYGNGDFTVGADGSETYCYWCGQGGQVFCCSTCTHVFCKKCVRLNFGRKIQKEIDDSTEWSCYACNPRALWEFRAQCWGLFTFNEMRKNNLVSFTSAEELRLPGYNIVECCSIQRRAGKPLKIISFRYLLPKKQEENKEIKNETVNNKNKPITSNGKVTYPFKILPAILRAEGDPVIPTTKEEPPTPPVPTALTPALKILPNVLSPSTKEVSPKPAVRATFTPAIKVRTPGTVNAAVSSSAITPAVHPTSEIIVRTSGNGGVNTTQRVNYVNPVPASSLKNNEVIQRRTQIQRKPGSSYLLVSSQTGNSTLVPFNSVAKKPMPTSKNGSQTTKQPVTYDVDDDDDVVIIDEAFDSAVKKMELEWFVKSLEQAEKLSKTFQNQCESIKQSFMSEVKSNKIDAKQIRSFSGKMHSLLMKTAVKLACTDDKHITQAFSDWLKAEKSKHQKPPPSETPAPKTDTDCYFDMECCESDNEEGEDEFETAYKKSVLECSETLSDVEFEDDVRNNISSSMQKDRLATLTKQTSSLEKKQCDTDQNKAKEDTPKKAEWSGAFSDFLVNCSDTSKRNGAPLSSRDETDTEAKSGPCSEKEFSEEVQRDKTNSEDKPAPPSGKEASDLPTEPEVFVKEKSPAHSENEASDSVLETALCDKEDGEKSPPPSEIDVSDPLMETGVCDKEKSPPICEIEVLDPLMVTPPSGKPTIEEKSPSPSEIDVSDPLIEATESDKEESPTNSEIEVVDPLMVTSPSKETNRQEKSPPLTEMDVSDPLVGATDSDKEESAAVSEIEVLDPLMVTSPSKETNSQEKSPPPTEMDVSDPLVEATVSDKEESSAVSETEVVDPSKSNTEEKLPPPSEIDVADPLMNKTDVDKKSSPSSQTEVSHPLGDKTDAEEKSSSPSEVEAPDPVLETSLVDKTNNKEKSQPTSETKASHASIEETPGDKLGTEDKSPPTENKPSNPVTKPAPKEISEVLCKVQSLKRPRSSSPDVESKIRKLESRCRNAPLTADTEKEKDMGNYKKFGLKNFTIKLTDIDTKE